MPKSTSTTPPLDREAKRRLALIRHVEEVTGNVAMSCRYFGFSRQAYYTWYRRYQAEGVEGLRTSGYRAADWLRKYHHVGAHPADHRRISTQLTHADDAATTEALPAAICVPWSPRGTTGTVTARSACRGSPVLSPPGSMTRSTAPQEARRGIPLPTAPKRPADRASEP